MLRFFVFLKFETLEIGIFQPNTQTQHFITFTTATQAFISLYKIFKIKNACHKNKEIKQIICLELITISLDKNFFICCLYASLSCSLFPFPQADSLSVFSFDDFFFCGAAESSPVSSGSFFWAFFLGKASEETYFTT